MRCLKNGWKLLSLITQNIIRSMGSTEIGMKIAEKTSDPVINLALDTIEIKKQALLFVNAKRSAEKVAEDISKKTGLKSAELDKLSESIKKVLSKPTKQ